LPASAEKLATAEAGADLGQVSLIGTQVLEGEEVDLVGAVDDDGELPGAVPQSSARKQHFVAPSVIEIKPEPMGGLLVGGCEEACAVDPRATEAAGTETDIRSFRTNSRVDEMGLRRRPADDETGGVRLAGCSIRWFKQREEERP
jgi:hypothetical protein